MPTPLPHIDFVLPWDLIETQLEHHGTAATIWHSRDSTFWSHQRGHALVNGPAMTCPLGTQIYAEKDWRAWLETARENPSYYGRHGLKALLAGHYSNVRSSSGAPYAARSWRPYNDALDLMDAEQAKLSGEAPKRIDLKAGAKRRPAIIPGRAVRRG